MGVQFFFDSAKHKINGDFPHLFGEGAGGGGSSRIKTRGIYEKWIAPFGWLNSLYAIAEKGVFKKDGMNGIESVKETNLYKVLAYLSWTTAKNEYENAVQEKIHNPKKTKIR